MKLEKMITIATKIIIRREGGYVSYIFRKDDEGHWRMGNSDRGHYEIETEKYIAQKCREGKEIEIWGGE